MTIRNLTVRFATSTGSFTAVDGIDVRVDKWARCWPSSAQAARASRLDAGGDGVLPDTATVTADEMSFDGRDLLA